jgi:hypothetical protein
VQAVVRGRGLAAVAALLVAGGARAEPPLPADAPLLAALDRCIAELEAETGAADESGPTDARKEAGLAERCPAAHAGLRDSALGPQLPPDWDARVSAEELRRYRALVTTGAAPGGRRPDPAAVAAIVRETEAAVEVRGRSLWQRFKDWLRAWLERKADEAQDDWLARWLDEHFPSEQVIDAILYGVLLAMVCLAGGFLYTELRAAGVFDRPRRRRGPEARAAEAPAEAQSPPSTAGAGDREAPSALVALLLGELRRLGRVQDRSSMTYRELARAARFAAASDEETFRSLLGAAERLRYGAVPPPPGSLRAALDAGRRLLEALVREPRGAT